MILVLRKVAVRQQELRPAKYNVESKRMVKNQYGFDVRAVELDDPAYLEYQQFFSQIRAGDPELRTNRMAKGILRIEL